jgi:hypothetical protein
MTILTFLRGLASFGVKAFFNRIDELFFHFLNFHLNTPNYINCFFKTATVAELPEPEK